jgi:hypothetical protein
MNILICAMVALLQAPLGLTHTIAEVTPMRDSWIKDGAVWKLQSRVQLAAPTVFVDKLPPDIENPPCPL